VKTRNAHGMNSRVDMLAKMAPIAMARAHSVGCRTVSWSPDERQLVSASVDGSLCVWNFYP
jgi:WD40 repeat protein